MESPLRRWARRLWYVLSRGLGAILLIVLIGLGVLQTQWGGTHAARLLAHWANPFENAVIRVGEADGTWVMGLELRDVALIDTSAGDSLSVVHIDTVRARYALPALLRKRVHFRDLTIVEPTFSVRQRPDSSWTLPALAPSPPDTSTAPSAWTVQIDQIDLRRGHGTAHFHAPDRDSTLQVANLTSRAHDLRIGTTVALRLDTLDLRALPPGTSVPLTLRSKATLTGNQLTLDRLALNAPNSRVRGQGTLRWLTAPTDSLDNVDFTLTAAPLDFQDLAPIAPVLGLNPEAALQFDTEITGSGRRLHVRAEGDLSTGGSLTLNATGTPALTAPPDSAGLLYEGIARVRNLTTDFLARSDPSAPHHVNADLQLDLRGPALDRLSGALTARLFESRLSGYAVSNTRLTADLTDGQSRIDLQGRVAGAEISINGTARPLDATPPYDLTARLAHLDLEALAPESAMQSDLTLVTRLRGRGVDPQTATLTADVTVEPSLLNRQRVETGHLQLNLADGSAKATTTLTLPEGRLAAAGHVTLASPLRYTLDRGQFDDLNVAALLGDTTTSTLSGTIRGQGEGTDPATLSLTSQLTLRDSHYGPYVLNAATGQVSLQRGQLTTSTQTSMRGGQFTLGLVGRPFAEQPTFRSTKATFRAVDLGAFLQDSTQYTDLNGSLSFATTGVDPATLRATTTVSLDSSQVNLQPIDSGRLEASLRDGALDADVRWTTPDGTSHLAGTVQSLSTTPQYALRTGTLEEVDLGALLGLPEVRTNLNGTLTLEGRGTVPSTMALDGQLTLGASSLNQATIKDGQLAAHVEEGSGTIRADLAFSQGRLNVQASGQNLGADPRYQIEGRASSLPAAALVGADTLDAQVSLRASIEGQGLTPETARLTGHLTADPSYYGALRLDTLNTNFQFTEGLLRVDTLRARSNITQINGGGTIAVFDTQSRYTSDFMIEGDITTLDPLRKVLGVQMLSLDSGRLEGRMYGPPGTLRFELTTALENLVIADTRIGQFEGHVAGTRGDTSLVSVLEARGQIDYIGLPSLTVQSAGFNSRYDGTQAQLNMQVALDQTRTLKVTGTAYPTQSEITLRTVDLRLGPDRWQLLQEATLAYGDAYRVRNLLLYSDQQQLAADGVIDFDGEQSLIVTLEGFRMDALAGLFGLEGLGGSLTGTLELNGPAESPQFIGTLNLDILSDQTSVGELELQLDYADLQMQTDALLTHVDGSTLTLTGGLPVDLRLNTPDPDTVDIGARPVDLALAAKTFSIGWIDPFLDPTVAQDAAGLFTANMSIGGTRNQPDLDGQATLRDGSIFLPTPATNYTRINADLSLQDNQVVVRQATMRSGGGRMEATGTIDLTELTLGTYNLDLTADDFLAADTREYRVKTDGDVTLRGTTRRPILRGAVQVQSADFYLVSSDSESDLATVQLTTQDEQVLEQRFGIRLTEADTTTFDTYEAMDMELTVELERDTWLRSRANPEMDVQFTGSLDVSKAPYQEEQVFGTIEVVPERSRVVQFGRVFKITRGTLTFNGPATDPILDLVATYEPRTPGTTETSVTITLAITGRPDQLNLSLSSSVPGMPTSDIFCYIAVARPCGQFSGGQSGGLAGEELAGQVAFTQAANLIENLAASKLGLDVVRIENRSNGTFLTAGQYISPRFFASIEQPITTSADSPSNTLNVPNITLEYELMRWLLARAMYLNPDFRLNLFWEYAY